MLERLFARHTFGIKPGLQVEQCLLRLLGNPERSFAVIHVAGTNGKGSVCAMLDSVLRAAGLRVGLYTSPHLMKLNERFHVNGHPIKDEALGALIRELEPVSDKTAEETGHEPTFFEYTTALAFEHFRRERVQIAVVETGLGGRLDATNVVHPLVSVITRVGLEHMQYLGPDIESIAREKGGIIKDSRPVVCGAMGAEALRVLRGLAVERHAPLTVSEDTVSVRHVAEDIHGQKVSVDTGERSYGTLKLPLTGRHQLENLATVIAVLDVLDEVCGMEIPQAAVKAGMAGVRWPGRLQVLGSNPPMLADGAHNPDAASALAHALKSLLKGRPLGIVMGMCSDKDVQGFLGAFAGLARRMWIVPIRSERSLPAEQIASAARALRLPAEVSTLAEAAAAAGEWAAKENGAVCFTGSLFLVGEVLELWENRAGHEEK